MTLMWLAFRKSHFSCRKKRLARDPTISIFQRLAKAGQLPGLNVILPLLNSCVRPLLIRTIIVPRSMLFEKLKGLRFYARFLDIVTCDGV